MKKKIPGFFNKLPTRKQVLIGAFLAGAFFATCHNPIISRWWNDTPVPGAEVSRGGENFGVVIFNTQGGTPHPQPMRIIWGGTIGRLRPLSRGTDGFVGWFDERGQPWDVQTRQIRREDDAGGDGFITLTARWYAITFTVSFVPDYPYVTITDQMLAPGSRVVEPAPIERGDPLALIGWYTEPNYPYGRLWNFAADTVSGDMTLYARYSYEIRTVHFEPNGGTRAGGTMAMAPVNFAIYIPGSGAGGRIIDPGPIVRDGHAFGGWYTDPGFLPATLWNFATDRVMDRDQTVGLGDYFILYAQWVPNIYLVTFNAGGGTPASITVAVVHGERAARPSVTNPGKVVVGWYNNAGFSGTPWNFDNGVTSTMTLYARWEDTVYIVRFHLGNPNGAAPHPVFVRPADQRAVGGGMVTEAFMPPLPDAAANTWWSFYRWDHHPSPAADDPARINEAATFRNALLPWNFQTDTVNGGVTVAETGSGGVEYRVLNLYARWVPPVQDMVWVPRGSFIMGDSGVSGSPADYHAFPTRTVTLDGFYIARTEVTQAQYRELMTNVGIPNPSPSNKRYETGTIPAHNNPVEQVSWFDAVYYLYHRTAASSEPNLNQVFAINITSRAGDGGAAVPGTTIAGSINAATVTVLAENRQSNGFPNGYRLPTEAEWEFAARGGHGSPNNFMYAGSNNAQAVAWFNQTVAAMPAGATQVVGTRAANALGIFDMSGNVSEWCWDWFASYRDIIAAQATEAHHNPQGPSTATERVRRGGSWNNAAGNVRSVVRNSSPPAYANWVIGFRPVRGPSQMW